MRRVWQTHFELSPFSSLETELTIRCIERLAFDDHRLPEMIEALDVFRNEVVLPFAEGHIWVVTRDGEPRWICVDEIP